MLIGGGFGPGKTNALFNLIKDDDNLIDKIYLYAKDLNELKNQFLIRKCEDVGIKILNDSKAFIEYSQCMDDVYNNIDDYNPSRKREMLIVLDDMTADIMTSKTFQAIIKELFTRCRKQNISLAFIAQSYFFVPKEVRINSTHYLIMKIHNKKKSYNKLLLIIQQKLIIVFLEDLECTREPYCFLTIDTTLPADDPLRFRKNLLDPL